MLGSQSSSNLSFSILLQESMVHVLRTHNPGSHVLFLLKDYGLQIQTEPKKKVLD